VQTKTLANTIVNQQGVDHIGVIINNLVDTQGRRIQSHYTQLIPLLRPNESRVAAPRLPFFTPNDLNEKVPDYLRWCRAPECDTFFTGRVYRGEAVDILLSHSWRCERPLLGHLPKGASRRL
jgi:hypothetical protein